MADCAKCGQTVRTHAYVRVKNRTAPEDSPHLFLCLSHTAAEIGDAVAAIPGPYRVLWNAPSEDFIARAQRFGSDQEYAGKLRAHTQTKPKPGLMNRLVRATEPVHGLQVIECDTVEQLVQLLEIEGWPVGEPE